MNDNNIEKWVTLKEIQAYLGVGRETILQWIAKRNMPAYKMGRLWKFKISEVDAGYTLEKQLIKLTLQITRRIKQWQEQQKLKKKWKFH